MLRENLSQLQPETGTPTHLLPMISRDIMYPLSLRHQRYVSSGEEWALFNKLKTGNNNSDVILEKYNIPRPWKNLNAFAKGLG